MYTCEQEKWGPALAVRLTATALAVRLTATSKRLTDSLLPHHLPIHAFVCTYGCTYMYTYARKKWGLVFAHANVLTAPSSPANIQLHTYLCRYVYIPICIDMNENVHATRSP